MQITSALVLFIFSTRIVINTGFVKSCKYWCKTEDDRYYCCPSGKAESWKPPMKEQKSVWPFFALPWLPISFDHGEFEPSMWWPSKMKEKEKEKEKKCPAVRPHCSRSMDWYRPPSYCHCDDECHRGTEKCCYDVCLDHKTCKPVE